MLKLILFSNPTPELVVHAGAWVSQETQRKPVTPLCNCDEVGKSLLMTIDPGGVTEINEYKQILLNVLILSHLHNERIETNGDSSSTTTPHPPPPHTHTHTPSLATKQLLEHFQGDEISVKGILKSQDRRHDSISVERIPFKEPLNNNKPLKLLQT